MDYLVMEPGAWIDDSIIVAKLQNKIIGMFVTKGYTFTMVY